MDSACRADGPTRERRATRDEGAAGHETNTLLGQERPGPDAVQDEAASKEAKVRLGKRYISPAPARTVGHRDFHFISLNALGHQDHAGGHTDKYQRAVDSMDRTCERGLDARFQSKISCYLPCEILESWNLEILEDGMIGVLSEGRG